MDKIVLEAQPESCAGWWADVMPSLYNKALFGFKQPRLYKHKDRNTFRQGSGVISYLLICDFITIRFSHVSVFLHPPLRKLQLRLPTVFLQTWRSSYHLIPGKHARDLLYRCHHVFGRERCFVC